MQEGEITSPTFQSEWYVNPRVRTPRLIFNQNPCSFQHEALLPCVLSRFSHVRLCDPVDCSPPGFSVHGIFQARILEWAAIFFSRGSTQSRDQTWVFFIPERYFTIWATRIFSLFAKVLFIFLPYKSFSLCNLSKTSWFFRFPCIHWGFPGGTSGKEPAC